MYIKSVFTLYFLFILILPVVAEPTDFDPFPSMEAQQDAAEHPVVSQSVDAEEVDWPQSKVKWQETKEEYVLTVEMFNVEHKTVKVAIEDNGLLISASGTGGLHETINFGGNTLQRDEETKGYLNKSIRFPTDADLKWMTYRWEDDKLKIVVPKKKLKSFI